MTCPRPNLPCNEYMCGSMELGICKERSTMDIDTELIQTSVNLIVNGSADKIYKGNTMIYKVGQNIVRIDISLTPNYISKPNTND